MLSKTVQFPYRFLALGAIYGCWIVAAATGAVRGTKRFVLVVLFGVLAIFPAIKFLGNIAYVDYPESYYSTNEATTTVANEYMPIWAAEQLKDRANTPLRVYRGNAHITYGAVSTRKIEASITASEASTIQVNTIYYPGWGIILDGSLAQFDWKNSQGVMRFTVPPGSHTVIVEFRETVLRFVGDVISVVSIILLFLFAWADRRGNAKK